MSLLQQAEEAVDRAEGLAQIMRHGVGYGLQLPVRRLQFNHSPFELLVELDDFFLGLLALADILQERQNVIDRPVGAPDAADGEVGEDDAAVLAHEAFFQHVTVNFASSEPLELRHIGGQVFRVGQLRPRQPRQLLACIAQHLANLVVDLNPAFLRRSDRHADQLAFKEQTHALLACAQCFLCLLSFGDVGEHRKRALEMTFLVEDGRGGSERPQRLPVATAEAAFVALRQSLAAVLHALQMIGRILREHEVGDRPADHLFGRIAEHFGHPGVDQGGHEVGPEQPDSLVGCVHDSAVLRLALLQRLVDEGVLQRDGCLAQRATRGRPADPA